MPVPLLAFFSRSEGPLTDKKENRERIFKHATLCQETIVRFFTLKDPHGHRHRAYLRWILGYPRDFLFNFFVPKAAVRTVSQANLRQAA